MHERYNNGHINKQNVNTPVPSFPSLSLSVVKIYHGRKQNAKRVDMLWLTGKCCNLLNNCIGKAEPTTGLRMSWKASGSVLTSSWSHIVQFKYRNPSKVWYWNSLPFFNYKHACRDKIILGEIFAIQEDTRTSQIYNYRKNNSYLLPGGKTNKT